MRVYAEGSSRHYFEGGMRGERGKRGEREKNMGINTEQG
jgi:hypothetical protein